MMYLTDSIQIISPSLPNGVPDALEAHGVHTILNLMEFKAGQPLSEIKSFRQENFSEASLVALRHALRSLTLRPYWLFADRPDHLAAAINDLSPSRPLAAVAHFLRIAYRVPHADICSSFGLSEADLAAACLEQVRSIRDRMDSSLPPPSEPSLETAWRRLLKAGGYADIVALADYLVGYLYTLPDARCTHELGDSKSGQFPEYGYAFSTEMFRNAVAFVAMGSALPETALLLRLANTLSGDQKNFCVTELASMGDVPRDIALGLIRHRYSPQSDPRAWEQFADVLARSAGITGIRR